MAQSNLNTVHAEGPPLEEVKPNAGDLIEGDPNVIAALPEKCKFIQATSFGSSLWTRTAKIITRDEEGSQRPFFLKISTGQSGRLMIEGEYEGMLTIHKVTPGFVPEPIAWGEYQSTPATFFFICEFIDMEETLPDPAEFCSKVAELHRRSVSPNGKYGFHVSTYNGSTPQENGWQDSWEVFFTVGLKHMLALDEKVNGPQPMLAAAAAELLDRVVPRLLRPLESGPSPIKPALVHGDLWCGNAAINQSTNSPVIFDASAFYAHNEYEMGDWKPARNRFNSSYFKTYAKYYPIAQPEEDYDDRILLYSIRFDFQCCILFPGSQVKSILMNNIQYLNQKYASTAPGA